MFFRKNNLTLSPCEILYLHLMSFDLHLMIHLFRKKLFIHLFDNDLEIIKYWIQF